MRLQGMSEIQALKISISSYTRVFTVFDAFLKKEENVKFLR